MASTIEAATFTSAAKVFNTFELLEKILIKVVTARPKNFGFPHHVSNVKAIYRLQRVNSTFRDVISRSKTLHEGTYQTYHRENGDESAPRDSVGIWLPVNDRNINPLFTRFDELLSFHSFQWNRKPCISGILSFSFDVEAYHSIDERRLSVASWRNMLFADVKDLWCSLEINVSWRTRTFKQHKIQLSGALTLGKIADEVFKAVETAEEADRDKFQRWV